MASSNKNINNFFSNNKFIGSFETTFDIPKLNINKECCFVGRSNVGKSSLINAVTKTKKLAKTSKTPGRTQAINIFDDNYEQAHQYSSMGRSFNIGLKRIY